MIERYQTYDDVLIYTELETGFNKQRLLKAREQIVLSADFQQALAQAVQDAVIDPHSPKGQAIVEAWLIAAENGEAKEGDCLGIIRRWREHDRLDERERCAKIAESHSNPSDDYPTCLHIAKAIRQAGEGT